MYVFRNELPSKWKSPWATCIRYNCFDDITIRDFNNPFNRFTVLLRSREDTVRWMTWERLLAEKTICDRCQTNCWISVWERTIDGRDTFFDLVYGGTVSVALQSNCRGKIREQSSWLGEFLSRSLYGILRTTRKEPAIFWGGQNWRVVIWQQNKVSSLRSQRHKGEDIWTSRETDKIDWKCFS